MNSLELALAIAIPVTLGVCILVAIPLIVKCYRRKYTNQRKFKNVDVEKAIWGHTRNISETKTPLLAKFTPSPSSSPEQEDNFPLPSPDRNMTFVFPATHVLPSNPQPPQPLYTPPPPRGSAKSLTPVADRFMRAPGKSPLSQVQTQMMSPPTHATFPTPLPPVRYIPNSLQPRSPPLPQVPSRSSRELGPMLPPSLSRSKTPDLLRRPSFLTQPREAPGLPGTQRTKSRRRPQPTLARIATTRSTRNYHAEDEPIPGSPVSTASIYSQSSATTSVWNAIDERPWNVDGDIPPIPELPPSLASPPDTVGHSKNAPEASSSWNSRERDNTSHSISDSFHSDTYFGSEEDDEGESPSKSGSDSRTLMESPLSIQYDPIWSHVLGDNSILTTSHLKEPQAQSQIRPQSQFEQQPTIRTNPESIASHPPKQVSDPEMTYSVPVYGVVSKEGRQRVYDRWEAIPITPAR